MSAKKGGGSVKPENIRSNKIRKIQKAIKTASGIVLEFLQKRLEHWKVNGKGKSHK